MDTRQRNDDMQSPRRLAPTGACDSHMHIYDPRFLADGANHTNFPGPASVTDYLDVQRRIGTQRTVVVTPRNYGTDNRVTLDAIEQLGRDRTRGVAVLTPEVTDAQLAALHDGGIRGIRFTLYTSANAAVTFGMVEPLARRIAELGWHIQLHWTAAQIIEHKAMLARLPCAIVVDHLGRLPMPDGAAHPTFGIVRRLAESGQVWVKLSGPYLDSTVGVANDYADTASTARAWIDALPERVVWGSDWPHVTESHKPDDARLFDLLGTWAGDDAIRERILVDNAATLYDFPAQAEPAQTS
ncbi:MULTISPECIES: amidohydrolase family protein [Paraburkholderia]|uniref:Amidohydrolase family protein n=2 Tax=Paraburkholderia TaxID=1822464 RepID=A0ABW9DI09_9BURK|nr:amidohydrolase family protein [Paraburkholderia bryophila]NYH24784.1 putative TIM-barrel fold metal-dependent hydrolase [Paraburkholderia bryophila]